MNKRDPANWHNVPMVPCPFCKAPMNPFSDDGPGIRMHCDKEECREKCRAGLKSLMERKGPICMLCGADATPDHECEQGRKIRESMFPSPPPSITLKTIDGRIIKRDLYNPSKVLGLTNKEFAETRGVEYVDPERPDDNRVGFIAWEELGQNLYEDPECRMEHEIKDKQGLWVGRAVFTPWGNGALRIFVEKVEGTTWHGRSANVLVSGGFQENRGWVGSCFGDARALARVDFS